jgi:AcrR family transcriptional regulator
LPKESTIVNRRDDLLDAALAAFVDRGFEGTSVAQLAEATGLSKAAFVYHFDSKEDLLFELAEPLLDELDEVVSQHGPAPVRARSLRVMLRDYLDALDRHHQVVEWVDGDKSVLNHGDLGVRLDRNNAAMHRLLTPRRMTASSRAQASAVLGMLWRPIRNGFVTGDKSKEAVIDLAAAAAGAVATA